MRSSFLAVCVLGLLVLASPVRGKSSLGALDDFLSDNENAGTCSNGMCTVHGEDGGEYSEIFEQFVPEFFAGAQDMGGLLEAAKSASESGDMDQMTKVAEKHQKETLKRLAPIVSAIYEQFVHPSSPGVDPETCRSIVREFLTACKRHMPLLARQSMDAGMKFGAMMAGSEGAAMMEKMEEQMGQFQPQIAKTMQAVISELIAKSDKMADDIFEAVDVNKDGIIPRKEFEANFATSMQTIVNMQALAQTAQKVMESISPADMEQLAGLLDNDQLKQLAKMDPEQLMQQLKALGEMGMGG
eukprot:CAMPEP_0173385764 /NCGR_PEP_ID=MMETSP1356-20130122/8362_1 /TAXON_ID=77927 ORGANISM="Hemiselmis virescens, Strain PCC157" /NCGR_SAMPLE_ID=MMETSP1356 /ASSEMBLY_ACC=CAM_ASM_000847 /LENGTH=298 /DNA_ID=CAMNT_0014341705 /DNA_START=24 /DNA_END=917 /DNA_ORIENTATION=+